MLNDRQTVIVTLLRETGGQTIATLTDRFGVASQTVRRDINELCELGLARRTHGGVAPPSPAVNQPFATRRTLNNTAKRAIGQAAADLIAPGSTVFLGIGTTVQFTAEALLGVPDLTVMTNNLEVAMLMCQASDHDVHVAGGDLRAEDKDLTGASTLSAYRSVLADVAVIGAGALDPVHGVLDHKSFDADLGAVMIRNARQCILVSDNSKWDKSASRIVAPFSAFSQFVTNGGRPGGLSLPTSVRVTDIPGTP